MIGDDLNGITVPIYIAVISAATAITVGVYNAWMMRNNRSADTYQKLAATVSSLTEDLGTERSARRQDKTYFQESLDRVVMDYERKIKALEIRVDELEKERNELLLENHRLKRESRK